MLKKPFGKLKRSKDLVATKDPSLNFELTSAWVSKCMATTQRDSIARIKRAMEDLNL